MVTNWRYECCLSAALTLSGWQRSFSSAEDLNVEMLPLERGIFHDGEYQRVFNA